MKFYQLILFIFINLFCGYVNALSYADLRILYETGRHHEAIIQANKYLQSHPNDGDVRLTLAQFYFQEKKYQQARAELLTILEQTPSYKDALLVLINCDIMLSHHQEAIFMANYGLLFNPIDPELNKKKADLKSLNNTLQLPYQVGGTPTTQILELQHTPTHLSHLNVSQPEYLQLKRLYKQKKHQLAIQRAVRYLQTHANDADVRLVLAQFYFNKNDFIKAKKQINQVLQQVPKYKDALLILINIDIQLKQFNAAKSVARKGLSYYPQDKIWQKKIEDIERNEHQPSKLVSPQVIKSQTEYHNEIGLYQQNYSISDIHQVWDYSTLYYAYKGKLGKIYGKVNYNERLGFRATQGEIEAFPKLTKNIYLALQAAIANEPNLFPSRIYGSEMYVSVPNFLDFSGGGKYNLIDSLHAFTLYTGSVSKQYNEHRLTYRLNVYEPNSGENSLLNLVDYRYLITYPNVYLGFVYGHGTSPDLANLATIDFLITHNQILSPYLSFTLLNNRLIVNTSFYYQHQVFTSLSRARNWAGGTLRLSWNY
jgi:YaiO family outer membrane protein